MPASLSDLQLPTALPPTTPTKAPAVEERPMSAFEKRRAANMAANKAALAEITPLAMPVEKKPPTPRKAKAVGGEPVRSSERQKEALAAAEAGADGAGEEGEDVKEADEDVATTSAGTAVAVAVSVVEEGKGKKKVEERDVDEEMLEAASILMDLRYGVGGW